MLLGIADSQKTDFVAKYEWVYIKWFWSICEILTPKWGFFFSSFFEAYLPSDVYEEKKKSYNKVVIEVAESWAKIYKFIQPSPKYVATTYTACTVWFASDMIPSILLVYLPKLANHQTHNNDIERRPMRNRNLVLDYWSMSNLWLRFYIPCIFVGFDWYEPKTLTTLMIQRQCLDSKS